MTDPKTAAAHHAYQQQRLLEQLKATALPHFDLSDPGNERRVGADGSNVFMGVLEGRSTLSDVGVLHDLLTGLVATVQAQDRAIRALQEEVDECKYRIDIANL